MNRPIILCGLGLVGWRVLEHVRGLGHPVVAIDTKASPDDPRLQDPNVTLVTGDCRREDTLRAAGVADAEYVLVLTSEDLINISCAMLVRRLDRNVRVVVRMFNENLVERLGDVLYNTVALSVSGLAAPRMARRALSDELLAVFDNVEGGRQHVVEFRVDEQSPLCGLTPAEARAKFDLSPVARAAGKAEPTLIRDEGGGPLRAGERFTAAGPPDALTRASVLDFDRLFPAVLMAGKLRRFGRVVLRTLLEVDLSVKIAGAVLAITMVASFLAFHYFLSLPWADSVYRSVSAMATMTDLRGKDYQSLEYAGAAKVFVSAVRITGAVLLAAFTAIFTNFLLRARLGGALEVRRIPDGGHVVVIGLGNVGFRLVEELVRAGERPVVVERSESNKYVATCRRLGVPVLVGDATVAEVLRQVHTPAAKAVIAATSDELVNLELALLVGDQAPKVRLVLRLSDPLLAETLQEASVLPAAAVSIPALAAPAFLAALFDDHVQGVFRVGEQDLVIVNLKVHKGDTVLAGQTVESVAVDYDLIPLGVRGADPGASCAEGEYCIREGDTLTVLACPADLGRLVQRRPVPRDWSVEVAGFPESVRARLKSNLGLVRRMSSEEAEAVMAESPFRFAESVSRGQAEEWLRWMKRERVDARLMRDGE